MEEGWVLVLVIKWRCNITVLFHVGSSPWLGGLSVGGPSLCSLSLNCGCAALDGCWTGCCWIPFVL